MWQGSMAMIRCWADVGECEDEQDKERQIDELKNRVELF
jgi:hypothetical protein